VDACWTAIAGFLRFFFLSPRRTGVASVVCVNVNGASMGNARGVSCGVNGTDDDDDDGNDEDDNDNDNDDDDDDDNVAVVDCGTIVVEVPCRDV
jgi:hypothetical protein